MRSVFVALTLALTLVPAHAQSLPDWSWSHQLVVEEQLMRQTEAAAWAAANQWYQDVQAYRAATGYTGFIPSPVSPESLSRSVYEAGQAGAAYINGAYHNSARMDAAVSNWSNQAILNQQPYIHPATGYTYALPWDYNSYSVNPGGGVCGTNDYAPPNSWDDWVLLQPGW